MLPLAYALTLQVFFLGSQSPFLLSKALYLYLVASFGGLVTVFAWRRCRLSALPPALTSVGLFVAYAFVRGPWFEPYRPEIGAPFLWGVFPLVAWSVAADVHGAPERVGRYMRILVCLGALTAAYAILQTFGIDLPIYRPGGRVVSTTFNVGAGGPPFATLGNPAFLGEYLAALLPVALSGVLAANGNRLRIMSAAGAVIAVALALTMSRGSWMGAAIGLGVTVVLFTRSTALRRRALGVALTGLVLALIAGALMERFAHHGTGPWGKVLSTFSQLRAAGEGRRLWWGATTLTVGDHPLLGVGASRFREAYPRYQSAYLASLPNAEQATVWPSPVEAAHNDYLQVAAELGIPGVLLLLAALAWIVTKAARMVRQAEGDERAWRAGALGGLVALLIAAFFSYPLHTASGLLMAACLAALAVTPTDATGATGGKRRWHGFLLIAATALGFWQTAHLLTVFVASLHLHRGTEALLRRDVAGALGALERAREVSPRDVEVRSVLGRAYLTAGRPDLALPHLTAATHGFDSPQLRLALAEAHAALGELGPAEHSFRWGAAAFPGYAPLHANYGAFLARQGRDAEAARQLERAQARDPDQADALYWLGMVRARTGDPAAAAEAFRHFLRRARPGDPRTEIAAAHVRRAEGSPPHVDNGKKPVN